MTSFVHTSASENASGRVSEPSGAPSSAYSPPSSDKQKLGFRKNPTVTLPNTAFFGDTGPGGETIEEIYDSEHMRWLAAQTNLLPTIISSENLDECLPALQGLQVIFSTWGMLQLTNANLDRLPALRAVFYAAGSVKYFARPLLERGIIVVSCAASNAVPVAEFTVAHILLANKGYFMNTQEYRKGNGDYLKAFRGKGNYDANVSLLGAGKIGRKVIELLRPYRLRIFVFDPFMSDSDAARLGVEKVSVGEAFACGDVVSNHLADIPETTGLIDGPLISSMPRDATFINTGRGRTCNHTDLIRVFRERPDLAAILDVTDPEPLPLGAPLWSLPNVHISGHIAGSIGNERKRNADYAIEEFERWSRGEPLHHAVKLESLDRTA